MKLLNINNNNVSCFILTDILIKYTVVVYLYQIFLKLQR